MLMNYTLRFVSLILFILSFIPAQECSESLSLRENNHFLVYIHRFYIDKWPNSRYSFNNSIVIFHFFSHR